MQELESLHAELKDDGRITPSYDRWGVANVPDTVADLLDVDADRPLSVEAVESVTTAIERDIDHVVVLVVDALGLHQLHSLRESISRLNRFVDTATLSPLTSTYPSETAAAMSTLYTGLQPIEHGLLGWYTRFEDPTFIGHSLPFATLDGQPIDVTYGHDISSLLDVNHREPITTRLTDDSVEVAYLMPEQIADSATSQLLSGPATLLGFEDAVDAFSTIAERISDANGRSYHLIYWGAADTMGHHHGTASPEYRNAVSTIIEALYAGLVGELEPSTAANTAMFLTADHGQINTDSASNIALDDLEESKHLELTSKLERNVEGEALYLAGGPRNVQLHLDTPPEPSLRDALTDLLSITTFDQAEVRERQLFGDQQPGAYFESRCPDLLAIPDHGSCWYDDGELDHIGMHGGLAPTEMIVPLLGARLSQLQDKPEPDDYWSPPSN